MPLSQSAKQLAAAESGPKFELNTATIQLSFGIAKEGGIKVLLGGKAADVNTHAIKLDLERSTC